MNLYCFLFLVQHVERLEKECQVSECLNLGQRLATGALGRFADADGYVLVFTL